MFVIVTVFVSVFLLTVGEIVFDVDDVLDAVEVFEFVALLVGVFVFIWLRVTVIDTLGVVVTRILAVEYTELEDVLLIVEDFVLVTLLEGVFVRIVVLVIVLVIGALRVFVVDAVDVLVELIDLDTLDEELLVLELVVVAVVVAVALFVFVITGLAELVGELLDVLLALIDFDVVGLPVEVLETALDLELVAEVELDFDDVMEPVEVRELVLLRVVVVVDVIVRVTGDESLIREEDEGVLETVVLLEAVFVAVIVFVLVELSDGWLVGYELLELVVVFVDVLDAVVLNVGRIISAIKILDLLRKLLTCFNISFDITLCIFKDVFVDVLKCISVFCIWGGFTVL